MWECQQSTLALQIWNQTVAINCAAGGVVEVLVKAQVMKSMSWKACNGDLGRALHIAHDRDDCSRPVDVGRQCWFGKIL